MSELDTDLITQMVSVMRPLIKSWGYKKAREHALLSYRWSDTTEEETEAYRRFLDRYFQARAVAATKRKHRRFAPIEAYEGGTK